MIETSPITRLLTFGHGTAGEDEIVAALHGAGVETVVDVRRYPGSRRHPHVARREVERWLPAADIGYRWDPRLGGRREPSDTSPHVGLRNRSFRAYADHMESEEFSAAVHDLLDSAAEVRTVIICAESVWWRCHRRMIADAVTLLHNAEVHHLMHDGRLARHEPTDPVRVRDGRLLYAGEATSALWEADG
jgi:uncharacterized protein (DUF488 family)